MQLLDRKNLFVTRWILIVMLLTASAVSMQATTVPKPFIFFNNTHFANSRLLDTAGAMRSNVVYDSWDMSCSATSCSNIPDQSTFLAKVATYVTDTSSGATGGLGNSFLIVLDFEDLVVDKATSQAQANLDKTTLLQFAAWVHGAYPTALVGLYDYEYSSNYQSTRALLYQSGGFTAFAPTLYQRWSDHTTWSSELAAAVSNDRAISSTMPIYPFISPYVGAVYSSGLLTESEWQSELSDLNASTNGAIIWTQSATNTVTVSTTDPWYEDLVAVLSPAIETSNTFVIKNEHLGLCAEGEGTASGSVVSQTTCASPQTAAQKWTLQRTSLDTYYLVNTSATSLYLGVSGDSTSAGAGLELNTAGSTTPTTAQTWHVVSGGNGYYVLIGDGSNKCMAAPDSGGGAQIDIDTCASTSKQLYSIRAATN